ncbi:MAG: hypothetical protein U5J64_10540 [Halobacteriales archaeon]|nr:hypothetical protein [Halobacteriales archaeon]
MTENRYGVVVFEGVCSDLSNAAYPVEEVRCAVEDSFDPPRIDTAVHLGLTLLHHGYVVRRGDGFTLSDEANEARDDGILVAQICETVEPRVPEGEEDEAVAFVEFVRRVVETLVGDEGKV